MNKSTNVYMIQSNRRILIKSILYRILGIIISFITANLFINNIKKALLLTILTEIIQTTIYILYEKIWNNIKYGIEFKIDNKNILK